MENLCIVCAQKTFVSFSIICKKEIGKNYDHVGKYKCGAAWARSMVDVYAHTIHGIQLTLMNFLLPFELTWSFLDVLLYCPEVTGRSGLLLLFDYLCTCTIWFIHSVWRAAKMLIVQGSHTDTCRHSPNRRGNNTVQHSVLQSECDSLVSATKRYQISGGPPDICGLKRVRKRFKSSEMLEFNWFHKSGRCVIVHSRKVVTRQSEC